MVVDRGLKTMVGIIAAILAAFAAYQASSVLAPLVLALFIMAIVWPLQRYLQSRMPKLVALAMTIVVTVSVCLAFGSVAVWGFSRVARSVASDAARYQALYGDLVAWLEARGLSVAEIWAEHFNVPWLLRLVQQLGSHANTTLTFWVVTLVYVLLGLLEVDDMRRKVEALQNAEFGKFLLAGTRLVAQKFRRYLLVRTLMSILTGLLVWAFARTSGLSFIGVPITIAILTFCSQHPSSRWMADLLGRPLLKPIREPS